MNRAALILWCLAAVLALALAMPIDFAPEVRLHPLPPPKSLLWAGEVPFSLTPLPL